MILAQEISIPMVGGGFASSAGFIISANTVLGSESEMVTEEEARKLWCPFARAHAVCTGGTLAINRRQDGEGWLDCNCLASACMAWRWKKEEIVTGVDGDRIGPLHPVPRGTCGLAS